MHIVVPGTVAIVTEGESNCSISNPLEINEVHPLLSVTVAVYSPTSVTVNELAVCPDINTLSLYQAKIVPALTVVVIVVLLPEQKPPPELAIVIVGNSVYK